MRLFVEAVTVAFYAVILDLKLLLCVCMHVYWILLSTLYDTLHWKWKLHFKKLTYSNSFLHLSYSFLSSFEIFKENQLQFQLPLAFKNVYTHLHFLNSMQAHVTTMWRWKYCFVIITISIYSCLYFTLVFKITRKSHDDILFLAKRKKQSELKIGLKIHLRFSTVGKTLLHYNLFVRIRYSKLRPIFFLHLSTFLCCWYL